MKPVRTLAHCMLGAVFVSGAVRTIRRPEHAAERFAPISEKLAAQAGDRASWLPTDPTLLVRVNAGVQLAGAALLAAGRAPRLASVVLAGSLLPTTLIGHPFWREEDPDNRVEARNHFLKNVGVLGGLLLAAVDTQGRPGLRWRASHASRAATQRFGRAAGRASRRAGKLSGDTQRRAGRLAGRAGRVAGRAGTRAGKTASLVGGKVAATSVVQTGKAGKSAAAGAGKAGRTVAVKAGKAGRGAAGKAGKAGRGAKAVGSTGRPAGVARRALHRSGC